MKMVLIYGDFRVNMNENKINYALGVGLVVLLVLIVYLGGRVKSLESDMTDIGSRVSDLELVLVGLVEPLLLEEETFSNDQLQGNLYNALDYYY